MKNIILASLLLFSSVSNAVFFSSADLYQWLDNDLRGTETYEGGMAKGYLMGVLDMLTGINPPLVCYPNGISALKLKMVVFDFMQNNPDLKNTRPDKLVYRALLKEWPCR